jgi:adenylate cyclase
MNHAVSDHHPARSQEPSGKSGFIGVALEREIVRSERQRVTLLIALLGFVLMLVLVMRVAPRIATPGIRGLILPLSLPLGCLLAGYVAYEFMVRTWLGRLLASGRPLPPGFRYLNVFVEISLSTISLVIGGTIADPASILAGAIPFLYFLFILLAALNLDRWLCVFAGGMACAQFLGVSYFLLRHSTMPVDPTIPVLSMLASPHQYVFKGLLMLAAGAIAGFVALQIRRQLGHVVETLKERDRAISIFGQHVSPEVADLLLKQPIDYTGQEQNVCVMFLDIRDFSKLASERSAPEIVEYLNALFAPMIPVINRYSGFVNKFLGDGFMAVFGAPLDDRERCLHAVRAALEILRQVELLNQQGEIPRTRLGIGLHFGQAVTGNVGSSQRKEYTIIGDVVNLASRIEQANKALESQLLVSEAVVNPLAGSGEFAVVDMGLVELKGQPKPVRLYKLA